MAKDVKPNSIGGPVPPKPITKEEFGRRLYKLMSAKGWRQAELARRAGIGRDSVSNYVAGKSFPTTANLDKLSQALSVDADQILPGHVAGSILAEKPDFKIEGIAGKPNRSWVYVNMEMSDGAAVKIHAIIITNNAENAAHSG